MADRYYTPGGITVGTNFQIGAEAPIDARFTVASKQGLDDAEFKKYEGLISYVKDEKTYYQFVDGAWKALSVNSAAELEEIIKGLIATETTGAMEFQGACAALPENPGKGDMYKVAGDNINIVIDEKAAKAGDTIIYNGEKWTLIPSGDDIEDTWRKVIAGGNELGNDETLELIAGENVTITEDGGKVTISSSYEDTHYESKLVVGNEATDTSDENVVENSNVHLNLVEDGVVRSSHKIVGAGGITVTHAKAVGEDGVNVITIEAPEGAKYDLAAKTENGEAIISLAGTDNTEDKVAVIGDDTVVVTVDGGKIKISAEGAIGDLQDEIDAIKKDINDNRNAWVKDDNDNTTYQFSIPTSGDDKGKLLVEKKEIGETTWTKVDAYDFTTPDELTEVLANYYTKAEIDGIVGRIDTGVHAVTLAGGTTNGTLKLTVDGNEVDNIAVTGLKSAAYETVETLNATAKGYADAVEAKIPTELGVMSVEKGNDAIEILGTAKDPTVGVKLNPTQGNVVLSVDGGLKAQVDLSHNHDGQYKKIQTAVVDPTANGDSLTFIDSIAQDAQGVITATKKTVGKVADATHADAADTAGHADAATKVDAKLTVKVGGATVEYDGSEAKTADVDTAITEAIGDRTNYTNK